MNEDLYNEVDKLFCSLNPQIETNVYRNARSHGFYKLPDCSIESQGIMFMDCGCEYSICIECYAFQKALFNHLIYEIELMCEETGNPITSVSFILEVK